MKHTISLDKKDEERKEALGTTYKELVLKGLLFMERQPQLMERIFKLENQYNNVERRMGKLEYAFSSTYKQILEKITEKDRNI